MTNLTTVKTSELRRMMKSSDDKEIREEVIRRFSNSFFCFPVDGARTIDAEAPQKQRHTPEYWRKYGILEEKLNLTETVIGDDLIDDIHADAAMNADGMEDLGKAALEAIAKRMYRELREEKNDLSLNDLRHEKRINPHKFALQKAMLNAEQGEQWWIFEEAAEKFLDKVRQSKIENEKGKRAHDRYQEFASGLRYLIATAGESVAFEAKAYLQQFLEESSMPINEMDTPWWVESYTGEMDEESEGEFLTIKDNDPVYWVATLEETCLRSSGPYPADNEPEGDECFFSTMMDCVEDGDTDHEQKETVFDMMQGDRGMNQHRVKIKREPVDGKWYQFKPVFFEKDSVGIEHPTFIGADGKHLRLILNGAKCPKSVRTANIVSVTNRYDPEGDEQETSLEGFINGGKIKFEFVMEELKKGECYAEEIETEKNWVFLRKHSDRLWEFDLSGKKVWTASPEAIENARNTIRAVAALPRYQTRKTRFGVRYPTLEAVDKRTIGWIVDAAPAMPPMEQFEGDKYPRPQIRRTHAYCKTFMQGVLHTQDDMQAIEQRAWNAALQDLSKSGFAAYEKSLATTPGDYKAAMMAFWKAKGTPIASISKSTVTLDGGRVITWDIFKLKLQNKEIDLQGKHFKLYQYLKKITGLDWQTNPLIRMVLEY